MTEQEWRKVKVQLHWEVWAEEESPARGKGSWRIAECRYEADADAIIRDHQIANLRIDLDSQNVPEDIRKESWWQNCRAELQLLRAFNESVGIRAEAAEAEAARWKTITEEYGKYRTEQMHLTEKWQAIAGQSSTELRNLVNYITSMGLEYADKCEIEEGHVSHWDTCLMCDNDTQQRHAQDCLLGEVLMRSGEALATYDVTTKDSSCHANTDGDCSWSECPQEANNRANYQTLCPLAVRGERF